MRITVELSRDCFDRLRVLASEEIRDPRSQAAYILQTTLFKEKPTRLEHVTAPPTVEDFNALVDCINALAEMVAA